TPLSFEVTLSDLEVKSSPDGPILAGCDELHVDATSVDLARGDVRLRAVELSDPRGRVRREHDGWRILDVLVRPGPKEAEPPAPSPGEWRIDRVAVTDGDLLFEDGAVPREVAIPLGALAAEVTGFTSSALREKRPIRVRIQARGGTSFDELLARGAFTLYPELD